MTVLDELDDGEGFKWSALGGLGRETIWRCTHLGALLQSLTTGKPGCLWIGRCFFFFGYCAFTHLESISLGQAQ